jgi:hypothetical protein
MTAILADWPEHAARDFGRKPLVLRHGLAQSPLFGDAALVRLIEMTPRENYHVNTMPRDASDPHLWREGDMSGLSGKDVMAAVANGFLWVHLQRVQEVDRAYRDLLDAAFAELALCVPGFESFKRSMSVLISSPRMNVAYHSDVPGQSLWQIRGRKRVWLYPARAPFLPQKANEDIALKRSYDTDLPYDPAFDAAAESFVLSPGEWATWPRACPHRVQNEDCVNVSFTTEHWTPELRADYAVNYANGLLRPWFGGGDLSRETRGPAYLAKLALAGAHKSLRRVVAQPLSLKVDFRVAPSSERGFEDIAPTLLTK